MNRLTNLLFKLLLLLLFQQIVTVAAANYRIVGGKTTTIDKVKYIVSLRRTDGRFFCGGSLVTQQYVVTAAHCVDDLKASEFKVHGGATYLSQLGVTRSVSKIVIPKVFNTKNYTMDVAVLKLSRPMIGKNIDTIPLCTHSLKLNDWVKVSGWGLTNENGTKPSPQLRSVNVRMVSREKCISSYRQILEVSPTMMCASVPGIKDSCSGDSGGPLVHRQQLCGIVSFGKGCARKQYPGVYTVVNHVRKFIRNAITS